MQRVVDIFWAQNFYFRQREPRPKLTFFCPYRQCGKLHGTQVIGANYRKPADQRKKRPHYRTKDEHIPGCPLARKLHPEDDSQRVRSDPVSEERRKSSTLVDMFCLDDWGQQGPAARLSHLGFWELGDPSQDHSEREYSHSQSNTGLNESTILDELVSSYLSLTRSQRREQSITFKQEDCSWTTTYADAFGRLYKYDPDKNLVCWSHATVNRFNDGFFVRSLDMVRLTGSENERNPELLIMDHQLGLDGLSTRLRDMLLHMSDNPDLDILMLFWGRLQLTSNGALNVSVRHFGHLAFRAQQKEFSEPVDSSEVDPSDPKPPRSGDQAMDSTIADSNRPMESVPPRECVIDPEVDGSVKSIDDLLAMKHTEAAHTGKVSEVDDSTYADCSAYIVKPNIAQSKPKELLRRFLGFLFPNLKWR